MTVHFYSFVAVAFYAPPPILVAAISLTDAVQPSSLGSMFPRLDMQDPFYPESQHLLYTVPALNQVFLIWELPNIFPGTPESTTCSRSKWKSEKMPKGHKLHTSYVLFLLQKA